MLAEGKDIAFKRDIYLDVYTNILGLMVKCDTSNVHRMKTKSLRIQWAKLGRWVFYCCHDWQCSCFIRNGTSLGMTGFDVDLD